MAGYRSEVSSRTASIRALSWSRVAAAIGGPPQTAAQLVVNPAVRLAGAVVGDRDQRVELAAQLAQLPMGRHRRSGCLHRGGRFCSCSSCRRLQQVAHLLGVEQPGDAEVVGLLVAAGRGRRAERRPVEDDLVEFGVGAQRGRSRSSASLVSSAVLRRRGRRPADRRPVAVRLARARGCAGLPARWPAAAGWAPTAGRCWRSRPGGATARTGRSPARRTAASTRWWRRRRPTAGARRRPRTPSAPRPASGWCRRRTSLMRAEDPGSSDSTTVGASDR